MKQERSLKDWEQWFLNQSKGKSQLPVVQQLVELLSLQPVNAKVITVTGTNGKGGFVKAIDTILQTCGYKTASFTSPHIHKINERITHNGHPISDEMLLCSLNQVRDVAEALVVETHFFDTLLAAALISFQSLNADYWILEVGIGGLHDPVNAIDADFVAITSIGLDHQEYLGNTREAIAAEKCGLLRASSGLVSAEPDPPAPLITAATMHSSIIVGKDYSVIDDHKKQFTDKRTDQTYLLPDNGLSAYSQAAALMMAKYQLGLSLPLEEMVSCLKKVSLFGRLQRFDDEGISYCIDVAHNVQAVEFLTRHLSSLTNKKSEKTGRRLAVLSMMSDKAVEEIISTLQPYVDAWFVGDLATDRAMSATDLAALLHEKGEYMISVSKNMRQAFARAQQLAQPGDEILVVGSFYVVAELYKKLDQMIQKRKKLHRLIGDAEPLV
ncbi:MAG: Mur ligase family protein [Cellvibrionales bacterium]|nr:Mur ligase family protein [Cellvibrionales bacterium]